MEHLFKYKPIKKCDVIYWKKFIFVILNKITQRNFPLLRSDLIQTTEYLFRFRFVPIINNVPKHFRTIVRTYFSEKKGIPICFISHKLSTSCIYVNRTNKRIHAFSVIIWLLFRWDSFQVSRSRFADRKLCWNSVLEAVDIHQTEIFPTLICWLNSIRTSKIYHK